MPFPFQIVESPQNIVIAYDANEIQGRYFLVLEFVDGPNLEQLVRRQGPLSAGLACDYIRQSANGLQCAHQLGMVHRTILRLALPGGRPRPKPGPYEGDEAAEYSSNGGRRQAPDVAGWVRHGTRP